MTAAARPARLTPSGPPAWFVRLARELPSLRLPEPAGLPAVPNHPVPARAPRRGAVLVLFGPGQRPGEAGDVLLTRRSARLRSHAG